MAKGIGTTEIVEELEKQTQKVKVEVQVAPGIVEFLDHLAEVPYINVPTLKEFVEQAVLSYFGSMLDAMPCTIFNYAQIHKWFGLRDFPDKEKLHLAAKWS